MDTTRDFTSGPIVGPLIRFSMPILAALFLQALYGAVDLLVVGKYAATADVSGVAVGSQIMMTVTGLISSLAMGSTILLGQKLGMREEKDCGSVIGASAAFFGLVGFALTLLLPALSAVLARLMNAPQEAFRETRQYIAVCGGGSLAIVAYNVLGSVMRGLGDSRTPLMTVAIACAVNITGDLLLVAVLHLGAAGAAIATDRPAGRVGEPELSRDPLHRQQSGSRCQCRRGGGGKGLRLHHADALRLYAGHERLCGPEPRGGA